MTATTEDMSLPETMVRKMRANDGLAPLDIDRFWADQEDAMANPFGNSIPQVPLGMQLSRECIFAELGIDEDWHRLSHDPEWVGQMCRVYNDKAEPIVGKRLLNENVPDPTRRYPPIKQLHDIFEAENRWHNDSYWLMQSATTESELEELLDRVERRLENLSAFVLPDNWESEKQRLMSMGINPPLYRGQRGPITFAMSVFGVENLIYLLHDNEDLSVRFRDLVLATMLELGRILDCEAGYTEADAPHGFSFCDDNCCLLTADMYELFGYPILKGIFERYSPEMEDNRYQHSDSAMAHLLPLLGKLDLTGTNFGPTVTVKEIREYLPNATIYGQLAPFTLSRNEEENIVAEFIRDFEQAKEKRGLVFTTAGSINNGSRLTAMRLIMATIQEYGRYDK